MYPVGAHYRENDNCFEMQFTFNQFFFVNVHRYFVLKGMERSFLDYILKATEKHLEAFFSF